MKVVINPVPKTHVLYEKLHTILAFSCTKPSLIVAVLLPQSFEVSVSRHIAETKTEKKTIFRNSSYASTQLQKKRLSVFRAKQALVFCHLLCSMHKSRNYISVFTPYETGTIIREMTRAERLYPNIYCAKKWFFHFNLAKCFRFTFFLSFHMLNTLKKDGFLPEL